VRRSFAAGSLHRNALIADYPFLEPEDLNQALRYAAATLDNETLSIDSVA
jgi:uncharacterized protein (DUF433 family)